MIVDDASEPRTIKVVALNVNCDRLTQRRSALRFDRRFPRIVEFIVEQDADVVVLCELRDYEAQPTEEAGNKNIRTGLARAAAAAAADNDDDAASLGIGDASDGCKHLSLVERTFARTHHACTFRHSPAAESLCNVVLVHRRLGMVVEQRHLWPASPGSAARGRRRRHPECRLSPTFALVRNAAERDGRSVGVCVIELFRQRLPPRERRDVHRSNAAAVRLPEPSGRRLAVAAFHAGVASSDKRQQCQALAALPGLYDGVPLLIAGDFNVFAEDSPGELFAHLLRAGVDEVLFDDSPGTFVPYSHEPAYERVMRLPPQRLDRMFVAGGLRVALDKRSDAGSGRSCCRTHPIYLNGSGHFEDGLARQPPPDADAWKLRFPVDGLASDHFALTAVLAIDVNAGPSALASGRRQ